MNQSLSEVHNTIDTTKKAHGIKRFLAFLGPAYLVSVGYMDPGNWASDIAGGSKYGYTLIWVLLMSNLMAMLLQSLSAKLGIVRGKDLAQANRETYPKFINYILYILAEVAIAATDLAEILGMALGLQLLTGMPLVWGVAITVLDTFLLLWLQRLGMRKMEAFILALIAIIFISFFIQLFLAKPNVGDIVAGFKPSIPDAEALYISIAIIGATVMPHNLYLHSALVQSRKIERTPKGIKQALKFSNIDTVIALNLAFLVNAGILILAATVFHKSGNMHVGEIRQAHQLLPSFLGNLAPILFAIALIAAGQSSTVTGTLAGQIVMEGYLNLRLNPWARRLITRLLAVVPAVVVILKFGEGELDKMLLLSQVVLSLQLAFGVIPLIHFVSDKIKMGQFAIATTTKILAWLIAIIIVYLNLSMIFNEFKPFWLGFSLFQKSLCIGSVGAFLALLLYITFFPLLHKNSPSPATEKIHNQTGEINTSTFPDYKKIVIALDFSKDDNKLINAALGQGNADSNFVLIHILESATAKILGKQTDDAEYEMDKKRLEDYQRQLAAKGFKVSIELGFRNRSKEIARLTKAHQADLLVLGSHGHSGLMDFLYGHTVNRVRHLIKIPVFIVQL